MNKLNYTVSLRKKGWSKNEIKSELIKLGYNPSETQHLLSNSDEIFLNQLKPIQKTKKESQNKRNFKTLILVICFLILSGVLFYGYTAFGLIGLFII